MKNGNETAAAGAQTWRMNASPAPSLRVPVTADNRDFLRWLRAAELRAWETGQPQPAEERGSFQFNQNIAPSPNPLPKKV